MSDQSNPQPYYPAGDPSQQGTPASQTNTLAIVSLIAGIASYLFLPFIGAIVAVITGHMALGQIKRTGETGRGFALTGTILGYVHLALAILTGIVLLIIIVTGGLVAVGSAGSGAYDSYDSATLYSQVQS